MLCLLAALAHGVAVPSQEIAPGVAMPVLSIGTWTQGTAENATAIVAEWLAQGGRGIDTAYIYFDQDKVADALAASGVDRKEVFVTSKLPACVGERLARYFVEQDLKRLRTSYIDLMLVHMPYGVDCAGTWAALEAFVAAGKLRAIGVSNFKVSHLTKLLTTAKITPAVNQIEWNVYAHDDSTAAFCRQHNITVESYSPFGQNHFGQHSSIFKDARIAPIARAHNVSNAQVALRWILQRGHVVTFMSSSAAHQASDAALAFDLAEAELTALDTLHSEQGSFLATLLPMLHTPQTVLV